MSAIVTQSLTDIRRLYDYARVNIALSDVYILGKVLIARSSRFKVFHLFRIFLDKYTIVTYRSQHINSKKIRLKWFLRTIESSSTKIAEEVQDDGIVFERNVQGKFTHS